MKRCGLLGGKTGPQLFPRASTRCWATMTTASTSARRTKLGDFLRRPGDFDGAQRHHPLQEGGRAPPATSSSPRARGRIGSVNTIVRRPDGTLFGDNTDAFGFDVHAPAQQAWTPRAKRRWCWAAAARPGHRPSGAERPGGEARGRHFPLRGRTTTRTFPGIGTPALIVNATPVGMYPGNGGLAAVDLRRRFPNCQGVRWTSSTTPPARRSFCRPGALGIPCRGGLLMLAAQARSARGALHRHGHRPTSVIRRRRRRLRSRRQTRRTSSSWACPAAARPPCAVALAETAGPPRPGSGRRR